MTYHHDNVRFQLYGPGMQATCRFEASTKDIFGTIFHVPVDQMNGI
jgi:hypothetical protein